MLRHPELSTYNVSALRRILAGRLQLRLESVGGMHPDPAVLPGYGRIGVSDRGGSHGAVRVTVRPMVARAPACGLEGESRVRAMLPDDTALISGVALRVQTVPSNCPPSGDASAGRIEVTMDARFDDVRLAAP